MQVNSQEQQRQSTTQEENTVFEQLSAGAEIAAQLIRSSERTESGLQRVEVQQVAAQVLRSTALTRARYEAAAREGLAPRRSAFSAKGSWRCAVGACGSIS